MPLLVPEVCVPASSSRPAPDSFASANPPRAITENAAEPKKNPRLLIRFNLFSSFVSSTIARITDKLFPTMLRGITAAQGKPHVSQGSNTSGNSPLDALRGRLIEMIFLRQPTQQCEERQPVKDAFDEFKRTIEAFKADNDERLQRLERRSEDVVTNEKVDRINQAVTEQKRALDELVLASQRPLLLLSL